MSMMSELVKELRSAAKCYEQLNCDICTQRLLLEAADTIEALSLKLARHNLGSAEIVRCKDCKWHKKGRNEVDSWSICTEHNIRAGYVQDDDYCSWGERKEATT